MNKEKFIAVMECSDNDGEEVEEHYQAAFAGANNPFNGPEKDRYALSRLQVDSGWSPDDLIREMTRDAWAVGLEQVMISELAAYHRGREHGDVFAIISDELKKSGADESQIAHHEEEMDSCLAGLDGAEPGDLLIMLALSGAAPIQGRLRERGAK